MIREYCVQINFCVAFNWMQSRAVDFLNSHSKFTIWLLEIFITHNNNTQSERKKKERTIYNKQEIPTRGEQGRKTETESER